MKTKFIIVRHAEAVGNKIREFHGWTDEGITEKGKLQALRVAERLKNVPVDVIYSSSMKRTMETARYISEVKNLPIIPVDDLKEINGGLWEGMTWKDLAKKYPDEYDIWENEPHLCQMPEGECMEGFQQRIVTAVMRILEKEAGKNILIVTHGTAIKVLLCHLKELPLEDMVKIPWFDNTAVTVGSWENGKFEIEVEGDASHLDDETSTFKNQEWYIEYKKKFLESENV
ncbi:MAG TPA: histidine phosphatase family protein [Ruminiclostridium sp.]|jgi:probable phosphoglycerate mutase|nr:histidine phosphatase family protein [Ruminiclostridium sp.]